MIWFTGANGGDNESRLGTGPEGDEIIQAADEDYCVFVEQFNRFVSRHDDQVIDPWVGGEQSPSIHLFQESAEWWTTYEDVLAELPQADQIIHDEEWALLHQLATSARRQREYIYEFFNRRDMGRADPSSLSDPEREKLEQNVAEIHGAVFNIDNVSTRFREGPTREEEQVRGDIDLAGSTIQDYTTRTCDTHLRLSAPFDIYADV